MKSTKPILIAAVILAALFLIGSYTSRGQATYTIRTVTVQPGDTLWELGAQYAPKANREEWIYNVCKINGIDACLQVGQAVKIYAEVTEQ